MPATSRRFTIFSSSSFLLVKSTVNAKGQKTKTNLTDVVTFKPQVGKAHRERNILQYKRKRERHKNRKIICKVYSFFVL